MAEEIAADWLRFQADDQKSKFPLRELTQAVQALMADDGAIVPRKFDNARPSLVGFVRARSSDAAEPSDSAGPVPWYRQYRVPPRYPLVGRLRRSRGSGHGLRRAVLVGSTAGTGRGLTGTRGYSTVLAGGSVQPM